ncbi:polysaccharide deacetylase family protein [Desulfonatronospira sp.]|uniref:polysaccharide deacetylase family protein n=1 Tax=Desulfonatronospira sp. TaxID=1962951 RepID=UPI0025C353FE|nr:polysaccharide deacetylase family protein [Desulfonatronospira sp.]
MKLIITIDTEEDNWDRYSATDNPVSNIERIPDLQRLFDNYGVNPTYLVSYPVATNPLSVAILKKILEQGKCEIGMHCHPWNTPPFDEKAVIIERDTMLCNLPDGLIHEKMTVLHETICKSFGIVPFSFRAGRWGFGPAVAKSLCLLGYRVDSSVTPFVSWEKYQGPDFTAFKPDLFKFNSRGMESKEGAGPLLEVPVTIGFLQPDFELSLRRLRSLNSHWFKRLHVAGILERLRLLNMIWLSPELTKTSDMIKLAKRMKKNNYPFINLTFHSTSLKGNLGPFVKTFSDERIFLQKIEAFLKFAIADGFESISLVELEEHISI